MKIDYAEPNTMENERQHDWLQQYSIYVKHGTGQLDDEGKLNHGETKVAVWRCTRCGQIWRHP
ncbi:MAG: hypothetical protein ACXWQR_13055 [Ktedonobacterales bacterium]